MSRPRTPRKRSIKRPRVPGRKLSLQAAAEELRLARAPAAPKLLPSTQYIPPTVDLDRLQTSRLLPARYSDSVLTRIADTSEDLQLIFALDGVTNERLLAESNNRFWMPARELISGLPYARIINAAFAHPHPQGARFSTPYRGAWYAAFELATAKAEVLFHRSVQFAEISWSEREVLDYDHYHAEFSGGFHDLRESELPLPRTGLGEDTREERRDWEQAQRVACLDPESYIASQQLAVELLDGGALGVVYPSVRRSGGTCLACFRPGAVANVRKRDLHRLTWLPDEPPTFRRITRVESGRGSLEAVKPAANAGSGA